jgi:hypothetical protein
VYSELAVLSAGLFVWYCYFAALNGGVPLYRYLPVRIALGIIGALGAFGGMLLWEGMWKFWKRYDASSDRTKRFWFCVMVLFNAFGCAAYYHFVFRKQLKASGTT